MTESLEVRISDHYQPQPKQLQYHRSPAPYRLQVGGSGSGKSIAMLWDTVNGYALRYPGSQSLLLRKDFPELEKGLISDLKSQVPPSIYKWNDQKKTATFGNGSTVFFGHCASGKEKDLAQYLSSAFVAIGIDEMGQFSFEAWDFLKSRNRVNAGCQPDYLGKMPIPRMSGATNPTGPGWGWIRSIWADRRVPAQAHGADINFDDYWFIHSTIYDNQAQMRKDPSYVRKLEGLAPGLRKKFLDGDMNSIAGQYYSNFDPGRHIISLADDPGRLLFQPWQPAWIGLDWGLAHHTAVFWFTKALLRQLDGTRVPVTVVYRELAIRETSIQEVGQIIAEMSIGAPAYPGPAEERKQIKRIFGSHELFARRSDPNPDKTVASELSRAFRKQGLPSLERASGSSSHAERISGAVIVYEHFESGDLVMLDLCPLLARAIPTLVRDGKYPEDVEKSATMEDDLFDGFKHGVLPMLGMKKPPPEIAIRAEADKIQDPVARWNFLRKRLPVEKQTVVKPNVIMQWERMARR